MRSLYHPTNKLTRAKIHRTNAAECGKAGFEMFQDVELEMAEILERGHAAKLKTEEDDIAD